MNRKWRIVVVMLLCYFGRDAVLTLGFHGRLIAALLFGFATVCYAEWEHHREEAN